MKIMYSCISGLLLITIFFACNSSDGIFKKADNTFNLENIKFTEALPALYATNIVNENGVRYDSARDGKLTDSMLRYKISNTIIEVMKLSVPQKDFGFLYQTPETDSIARFDSIYFHNLNTLTDQHKTPVAYHAVATFFDPKLRKRMLESFKKKYGEPKYAFMVSHEFNQCSYEWQLQDRTIQIETSHGFSIMFGGSDTSSTPKQTKYYNLEMLIINNKQKSTIYDAHVFEFPEKILYDGKMHSYKDFQFEKQQVFGDNFLLNSTNEKYIKNEYGEYDINNAEDNEQE